MRGTVFVGRHEQLADLDGAVRDAAAGVPRVIVIGGPAGMGKTHLITHFADRLRERGSLTLQTSCVELGAAGVPLVPVTAAVRQLADRLDHAELASSAPALRSLERLLPERRIDGGGRVEAGAVADLFAAVLHRLGTRQLVVWLVDDLQWSDKSSRDVLAFLARTLRSTQVVIVVTHRDDVPDPHLLGPYLSELSRLPQVDRSWLEPLSRGEVAELMSGLSPRRPTAAELDTVFRRSGGNPLYVTELMHAAGVGGELPHSLRALLLGPVAALSEDAAAAVRVVAVSGVVDHSTVAGITGLGEPAATRALRSAVRARVVEPREAGYAIRHALLREAVLAEMLPVERARLHRACAEALERTAGPDRSGQLVATLALHWAEAGQPDKALPALVAAAEAAGDLRAYAEQAQLLERALRSWPQVADPEAATGLTLPGLYEATTAPAMWAGEYVQVLELVDRAMATPEVVADRYCAALLQAHRAMALHHLNQPGILQAVDRAGRLLPAEPSPRRLDVLDYLAASLTLRGHPDRAYQLAEESRRIAAVTGDPDLAVKAGITLGWVLGELGRYDASLAALDEAEALARRELARPVRQPRLWLNRAVALHGLGRYEDAVGAAREAMASPTMSGLDRSLGVGLLVVMGPALIAAGRLEEAEAATAQGLAQDPAPAMAAQLHSQRAEIALLRGDGAGGRRELHAARAAAGPVGDGPPALWELPLLRGEAELALATGDPAAAADRITRALRLAHGAPHERWAAVLTGCRAAAHPGLVHGHPATAASLRASLDAAAAGLPRGSPALAAYALQFDAESGTGDWAAAAAAWQARGHVVAAAHCLARAGQAALATDRAGAQDHLARALEAAGRAGASALADQVRVIARSAHLTLPGRTGASGTHRPLGLTSRELEVLGMVADGWSNKRIATALYVSPKTVSVHVSNILAKLGVASRGEAAAVAHRSGLVQS